MKDLGMFDFKPLFILDIETPYEDVQGARDFGFELTSDLRVTYDVTTTENTHPVLRFTGTAEELAIVLDRLRQDVDYKFTVL